VVRRFGQTMNSFVKLCVACCLAVICVEAATKKQWASRTIYQVLTDRFATASGSGGSCDLSRYCGGVFKGIEKKLDYIQGMGFDAVWISPIVKNTDQGYHGYWAQDITSINEHFGTLSDLISLRNALNNRGMYLMIDVVGNHMGNPSQGGSYSEFVPFNSAEHYHDCNGCPGSCNIENWNNQAEVEHCRLSGLPDLNQTNTFVRQNLIKYIKSLAADNCDGLRIDTIAEVEKPFWKELQEAIGVFAIGENYNGDINYVSGYQTVLDSVLSYPMYFTMRDVFANGYSMRNLGSRLQDDDKYYKDSSVIGTFIDNHDQPRFLSVQSDTWKYRNALVFTLFSTGIPIIYYGSEQGFNGGDDPKNREPLWNSNYDTNAELYQFLKTSIAARKKEAIWNHQLVERWQDDQFYAFTRGDTLVITTNQGYGAGDITRTITYHPYSVGTKLCNIYWPNDDCIQVTSNGITVSLKHGEPKVYIPA